MKTTKPSQSRGLVRVTDKKPRAQSPLVSSPATAEREIAGLRRGRKALESAPTTNDTDARATLI
jgi:hypothetical protein